MSTYRGRFDLRGSPLLRLLYLGSMAKSWRDSLPNDGGGWEYSVFRSVNGAMIGKLTGGNVGGRYQCGI